MNHFYQDIHGWFDFQKIYQWAVANAKEDAHFVEVGAYLGKSTSFMAVEIINSGKKITFDVVDTWLGSLEHQGEQVVREQKLYDEFIKNMHPVWDSFNVVRLTSSLASRCYRNESLDFVYIDACHDYEDVALDILSWFPNVKVKGVIAGHDFGYPSVERAVSEFFDAREVIKVSQFPESWCYIK